MNDYEEIALLLMDQGCNFHDVMIGDYYPLYKALDKGMFRVVERLILEGCLAEVDDIQYSLDLVKNTGTLAHLAAKHSKFIPVHLFSRIIDAAPSSFLNETCRLGTPLEITLQKLLVLPAIPEREEIIRKL